MADLYIDRMPSSHIHAEWNYYRLPFERPDSTWEWQSRNNYIEEYWGVETYFQADEYDYFLTAYNSYNPHEIMTAMFMDKSNYEKFVEDGFIYNDRITQVFFSGQIQTFRPTHNDTWYFVFVATFGETYLNASVRYTENYYEEPEPTEPDPTEPDPTELDPTEPDPIERNNISIPFMVGFSVLGLVTVFIVVSVVHRIKVRK